MGPEDAHKYWARKAAAAGGEAAGGFQQPGTGWGEHHVTSPADFALYKVDDRVTILKDVAKPKKSQLWKDDDTKSFGDTWMIVPITFYGLDQKET